MCCADSLTPIGMPPDALAHPSAKRAEVVERVVQSGNRGGETAGVPSGSPRTSAIRPDDLGAGQVAAGAGLRALAELEVERLHLLEHVPVPAEPAPTPARRSSGSSRPAPRAACRPRRSRCRCPRPRRRAPSAVFASCDSAPKLMSDTKTGMSSHSGLAAFGPDASPRVDRLVVEQREAVQLRGQRTAGRPTSAARARGTPIAATVPCAALSSPLRGQLVDLRDVRLLGGVLVRVVEQPVVGRRSTAARAASQRYSTSSSLSTAAPRRRRRGS